MSSSNIPLSARATKSVSQSFGEIAGGSYTTITINISNNPATYRMIKGYLINGTPYLCPIQIYCPNTTQIIVRAFNMTGNAERNGSITVYYI